MAAVGDIVTLRDGSVGVVGEEVPSPGSQVHRVYFPGGHVTITDADIVGTLSATVFNVGDAVALWPYGGTIAGIDGDDFTLSIERQAPFDFGHVAWEAEHRVPRWRVIRDNDERMSRVW